MVRSKYRKPEQRRFLTCQFVARRQVGPNTVRVTIGGPDLRDFTPMGFDQWFRLFLPNGGTLRLPTVTNGLWAAQYMMMGKSTRPIGRNYTVRAHRPDPAEIDIDFAVHTTAGGELGPATAWATSAGPGSELAVFDEGITYQPPVEDGWQLLVGDHTALPAVLSILRDAPRDLRAEVFLEIPDARDAQEVDAPDGANIHWLVPNGTGALDALRGASFPDLPGYAFLAGGQALVTGARRHLVGERAMAKERVTFTGYWRQRG